MSSDGVCASDWVKRPYDEVYRPVGLRDVDLVEYKLSGDSRTHGPSLVGTLYWGLPAPGDEGRIVAYRKVVIAAARQHGHYFKPVAHLDHVDVYRVLELFGVTDPCLQHAVKKLLVAGGRGAGKDIRQDVKEAIDSLQRWQEMRAEDERGSRVA